MKRSYFRSGIIVRDTTGTRGVVGGPPLTSDGMYARVMLDSGNTWVNIPISDLEEEVRIAVDTNFFDKIDRISRQVDALDERLKILLQTK